MARRYFSSTAARTALSSSISASATSFAVDAATGWPSSYPYTLILDPDTINEEVIEVTNRSGTTLTVTRGVDGTSAVTHSAGAVVQHGVSARDFDEPNAFLNAGGTVAGPTLVTANSASNALEVRQVGAGNAFVVEDSANPDASPFVIDATGQVTMGLGASATPTLAFTSDTNTGIWSPGADTLAVSTGGTERLRVDSNGRILRGLTTAIGNASLQIVTTNTDAANSNIVQGRYTADTSSANLTFRKGRGSAESPTVVSSGDDLGYVYFTAYDGSTNQSAAAISGHVDATPGASDMPGRLTFWTTPDGSTTLTERMRIDNAGLITGTGTSLGAWTAWTPTLGGTGWALGDGTATGYYCQIGKTVMFRAEITFGSTSTFGAAASPLVTLPVTQRNASLIAAQVQALFWDSSTATFYVAAPYVYATTGVSLRTLSTNGSHTGSNSTTPFTWADGDIIRWSGVIEVA